MRDLDDHFRVFALAHMYAVMCLPERSEFSDTDEGKRAWDGACVEALAAGDSYLLEARDHIVQFGKILESNVGVSQMNLNLHALVCWLTAQALRVGDTWSQLELWVEA